MERGRPRPREARTPRWNHGWTRINTDRQTQRGVPLCESFGGRGNCRHWIGGSFPSVFIGVHPWLLNSCLGLRDKPMGRSTAAADVGVRAPMSPGSWKRAGRPARGKPLLRSRTVVAGILACRRAGLPSPAEATARPLQALRKSRPVLHRSAFRPGGRMPPLRQAGMPDATRLRVENAPLASPDTRAGESSKPTIQSKPGVRAEPALPWRARSRVLAQPETDGRGLRMLRTQLQDPQVMWPGPGGLPELLRVEVGEREMRAGIIR